MRRSTLGVALGVALGLVLVLGLREADAKRSRTVPVELPGSEPDPVCVPTRLRAPPLDAGAPTARASCAPSDAAEVPSGQLACVVARVVARGGAPVVHATLVLRHGARTAARAALGAAGRVRFAGLVPGRYSLEVEADSLPPGLVVPPCAQSGSTRVPFTLARGDLREVPLEVAAAAALRGSILDPEGVPVAGATLRLQALDAELGLASRFVLGDEHGTFELTDVIPGTYRLVLQWPAGVPGAPPVPSVHTLEPGSFRALTLRGDGEPRAIRGQLVDEAGCALAGQIVQCEWIESVEGGGEREARRASPEPPAPWSRVLARARTDSDGRFLLAGLPRAEVALRAAPRVGASLGFGSGAVKRAETLVGRFDLRAAAPSVDAGSTVLPLWTR